MTDWIIREKLTAKQVIALVILATSANIPMTPGLQGCNPLLYSDQKFRIAYSSGIRFLSIAVEVYYPIDKNYKEVTYQEVIDWLKTQINTLI